MSPDRFRDLLDRATELAPPAPDPGAELADGRRRLRHRRLATVTASVLAVGAITAGGITVSRIHADETIIAPADSQAELIERCSEGEQSRKSRNRMFGEGLPKVVTQVRTDYSVGLVLEAADGDYWAECEVRLLGGEFDAVVTTYRASGTSTSFSHGFGPGCGWDQDGNLALPCDLWQLNYADRLPGEVDAVRFDLAGDGTVIVEAVDGYVLLNVLATMPEGETIDENGLPDDFYPLVRVYYLDASGTPIAGQDMVSFFETGLREPLDGLPPLADYPSLRGAAFS